MIAAPADYDPDVVHAGADPTGRQPSDAAFRDRVNAATAQGGGRLWCPATGPGGYVLTQPLNLANLADRPIRIDGDGQVWENGTGTVVIPDTEAQAAFDTTGSSAVRLSRFTIKSQARTRGARLLILAGRTAGWTFPQGHHYEDLILYAGTDPSANHGTGTIGIANISCEHFRAVNVRVKADVPFYFHGLNDLGIVAPHGRTLVGPWSMTMVTLASCSGYAFAGPAYDLADCDNIVLLNCHAQRDHADQRGYAIRLSGRIQAVRMIGGQVEQFAGVVSVGSSITSCEFSTLITNPAAPCVHLADGVRVEACTFRISQINGPKQPLFSNSAATILGGDIHLESGQRLVAPDDVPRLTLRGTTIHAADDEPMHVTNGSTYCVMSPSGWYTSSPAAGRGHV